jgi:UDP-N-acetylmuramyl pentapeptide phosphotransferase/UDP-N-acetylglucosamine-1-phosphate transferase
VAVYALGMALLGLVDDVVSAPPRGWRGHASAVLQGSFSTGALKAVGALGLACFVLSGQGWDEGRYVLGVGVLVLATNLLNLLDLRPGRSTKALVLLGAGLTLGAWDARPAAALGLFLGPLLVVGLHDLRERAMLGDTGSNLAGGLAGLWLVLVLDTTGLAVALALLLAITVYGERRSITELVERTPPLRWLDCLGRPDAHR